MAEPRRSNSRNQGITFAYYAGRGDIDLLAQVVEQLSILSFEVQVFIDDSITQRESRVLRDSGIRYHFVTNPAQGIPEGMHQAIGDFVTTDWVCLLQPDEVPCDSAFTSISRAVAKAPRALTSMGFPRKWLMRDDNYSLLQSRAEFIGCDFQWRIFRPKRVRYTPTIHTPGYKLPLYRRRLGGDATVYHVDWIVHDRESRTRKLQHYEKLKPTSSGAFAKWYVPETCMLEHRFMELPKDGNELVYSLTSRVGTFNTWVDEL
jgi:hypothetical protein